MRPSGQVSTTASQSASQPGGPSSVTDKKIIPDHRTQVWRLEGGQGQRTYNVSIQHAEAGPGGAFYYVAYADDVGDGKPHKLIAVSPPAEANAPGEWTQWSFTTSEPTVFVGNTWVGDQTPVFVENGQDRSDPSQNFPTEAYVSGYFGGASCRHGMPSQAFTPFFTNMHVTIPNQNPDNPSQATGCEIRVK